MFTGIINDVGKVVKLVPQAEGQDTRFEIATRYDSDTIALGASIACNGVCLTVVDKAPGWFAVQASRETLSKTTLGSWGVGSRINLERALRMGDELGGHIVSGHVDGVARVIEIRPDGESFRFTFEAPETLRKFVAPKGSVAIDGVSLTVNEVEGARFGINIIPHTQHETTFGGMAAGHPVNMEIDMLARYVARLLERD